MKKDNTIYIDVNSDNKAIFTFPDYNIKTYAHIGINGVTNNKKEGDGKTPLGEYKLGLILSTHSKEEFKNEPNLPFVKITKDMYWVDDSKSKYYNTLVDISKTKKDWTSAEHIIDFSLQYEYGIEIKANPFNVPGKGSAIFLHCINLETTRGCISINKDIMKNIIELVNKDTKIKVRQCNN